MTGTSPLLLVASAQSGLKTLAEVQAASRAGQLNDYGSPGSGSPMHLFAEMFNRAADMRLAEVAYRGVAPVINDLLAGVLKLGWVTPGAVFQHLRAGTLVPVAVTERARSPILPNVPTFVEAGFDIDISAWWGFFGPAGVPAPLVATLNRHLNEIIRLPEVEARTTALGVVTGGGDPARLTEFNGGDYEKFGRVVRELNIRVE
jgi:tripartite-type tricarboxylate transporter receptor subunit TctC